MTAALVPELDVSDLDASLAFYRDVLGFDVLYQRSEARFAYLQRDGAELMLEEAAGPGRRFRTAPLEPPFGRGGELPDPRGRRQGSAGARGRGGRVGRHWP